jgi:hypothetical protein
VRKKNMTIKILSLLYAKNEKVFFYSKFPITDLFEKRYENPSESNTAKRDANPKRIASERVQTTLQ